MTRALSRHVRNIAAAMVLGLGHGVAVAQDLWLPPAAVGILDAIERTCPACAADGYLPCGTAMVQYGREFPAAALQGEPPRGYLLAHAPIRSDLLSRARQPDYAAAVTALRAAGARLRLVILSGDWRRVRVLPAPDHVAVHYDPRLHACWRDGGVNCRTKTAQDVTLTWQDATTSDSLSLLLPIQSPEYRLRRQSESGKYLYYCHSNHRAALKIL